MTGKADNLDLRTGFVFIVKSFHEKYSLNYLDAFQDAAAKALVPPEGWLAYPRATTSARFPE
jgi:hypothetical protein